MSMEGEALQAYEQRRRSWRCQRERSRLLRRALENSTDLWSRRVYQMACSLRELAAEWRKWAGDTEDDEEFDCFALSALILKSSAGGDECNKWSGRPRSRRFRALSELPESISRPDDGRIQVPQPLPRKHFESNCQSDGDRLQVPQPSPRKHLESKDRLQVPHPSPRKHLESRCSPDDRLQVPQPIPRKHLQTRGRPAVVGLEAPQPTSRRNLESRCRSASGRLQAPDCTEWQKVAALESQPHGPIPKLPQGDSEGTEEKRGSSGYGRLQQVIRVRDCFLVAAYWETGLDAGLGVCSRQGPCLKLAESGIYKDVRASDF